MSSFVKGRRTGLFVSAPAPAGQPAAVPTTTITVRDSYAPAGSPSLNVRHNQTGVPITLPAGSALQIRGTQLVLTVTEDTEIFSDQNRQIPVVQDNGQPGTPISLAFGAELFWVRVDRLFRVHGTSASDFRIGENTQELTSVVYDSADSPIPWSEATITSKNWALDRGGNFKPTDPAYLAVEEAALEGREVYVRRVLPDEAGRRGRVHEGRALITNFTVPSPADNIITATWEFRGQGALFSGAWPAAASPSEPSMLDFSNPDNAINLMFI